MILLLIGKKIAYFDENRFQDECKLILMREHGIIFIVMKHLFVLLAAFILCVSIMKARAESGQIIPEPVSNTSNAFVVTTQPDGAEIYISGSYYGLSPASIPNLAFGRYDVRIVKEGCEVYEAPLEYKGGRIVWNVKLSRFLGFIDVKVEPSNAQLFLCGSPITPGISAAPAGTCELTIELFGYKPGKENVSIRKGETTSVYVLLEKASFSVSEIKVSKRQFNPTYASFDGKTQIVFDVTAPGKGTLSINNRAGESVYVYSFPEFKSRNQSIWWDGKSRTGEILPDGEYGIVVECQAQNGLESVTREAAVAIVRSTSSFYQSVYCGSAGLLFCPSPVTLPWNSFEISSMSVGHVEVVNGETFIRAPSALSLRYGFSNDFETDLLLGLILANYTIPPILLSGSLKYKYLDAGDLFRLRGALYGRASFHYGTGSDTFTDFTGLSGGLPFELRVGFFSILVDPELVISQWRVSGSSDYFSNAGFFSWMYLRAGVLFDFGVVSLGASAVVRTLPLQQGFAIDLPIQGGAELHIALGSTGLYLSGLATIDFESMESYYVSAGFGIGFLFNR
jgi:hypothetical protein